MIRRPDLRQTGWFDTPRIDQLPVSVANDAEPAAPPVRVIERKPEHVQVRENHTSSRPFTISIVRENSAATFSLSFTHEQFRKIIVNGSRLLGTIAVDLDELDDLHQTIEEDIDNE